MPRKGEKLSGAALEENRRRAAMAHEVKHTRVQAKGTLSSQFLNDFVHHYAEEGHKVFRIVFRENPETYFKALVTLVPKELLISGTVNVLADLSDADLLGALDKLQRIKTINHNDLPAIECIEHVNGNGRDHA